MSARTRSGRSRSPKAPSERRRATSVSGARAGRGKGAQRAGSRLRPRGDRGAPHCSRSLSLARLLAVRGARARHGGARRRARAGACGKRLREAVIYRVKGELLLESGGSFEARDFFTAPSTSHAARARSPSSFARRRASPVISTNRGSETGAADAHRDLRLVHRGLRYCGPEGRQGVARRAVVGFWRKMKCPSRGSENCFTESAAG
jgi:hypothetical protein